MTTDAVKRHGLQFDPCLPDAFPLGQHARVVHERAREGFHAVDNVPSEGQTYGELLLRGKRGV